ncbi:hypothetical protein C0991_001670 [Blastosporella zonata]|nr:hypothetical protein C0991_001670 [Blastosporella zonata]
MSMREAAADPSPLTRLIKDPAIIELARLKKQGNTTKDSKKVPSIRRLAIKEEEYELGRLKALLKCGADHLEHEARHAEEADVLARYAERQEKQLLAKVTAAELAKYRAETDLQASVADSQEFQLELQRADLKLQRLEADLHRVERLKDEYEKATIKAEEQYRQYKNRLLNSKMRESDMEEGHRIELQNALEEGREEGRIEGEKNGYRDGKGQGYVEGKTAGKVEGFKEGRAKSYREGKNAGRLEGLAEGYIQGRVEERRTALEAFDRFLDEEMDGQDDKVGGLISSLSPLLTYDPSLDSGVLEFVNGRSRYIAQVHQ